MLKRKLLMLRLLLCRGGYQRAKYLKKIGLFGSQGEHCFFTPYNYGTEPYLLFFGDNVRVGTDVRFITHDGAAKMFQYMDTENRYTSRIGAINVGNNVYIGARATILYDVVIDDNVIIGAGTLVNKNLSSGGIYVGTPARRVGSFEAYRRKSLEYSLKVPWDDQDSNETKKEKQVGLLCKKQGEGEGVVRYAADIEKIGTRDI